MVAASGRRIETSVVAIALTLVSGCHHEVKMGTESINLWANKVFEKCFDLVAGETLTYGFNASKSVLFNVHYHREKEIIYALAEQLVARGSGTLKLNTGARYCLMWTNPVTYTVKVEYDYTIR